MDSIRELLLEIELRLLEINTFLLEDEVDPEEVEMLLSLLFHYKKKLGEKESFEFLYVP